MNSLEEDEDVSPNKNAKAVEETEAGRAGQHCRHRKNHTTATDSVLLGNPIAQFSQKIPPPKKRIYLNETVLGQMERLERVLWSYHLPNVDQQHSQKVTTSECDILPDEVVLKILL